MGWDDQQIDERRHDRDVFSLSVSLALSLSRSPSLVEQPPLSTSQPKAKQGLSLFPTPEIWLVLFVVPESYRATLCTLYPEEKQTQRYQHRSPTKRNCILYRGYLSVKKPKQRNRENNRTLSVLDSKCGWSKTARTRQVWPWVVPAASWLEKCSASLLKGTQRSGRRFWLLRV